MRGGRTNGSIQRTKGWSNMSRGMKDGVGTVKGGYVMTSDVINQLDRVSQKSGFSSH